MPLELCVIWSGGRNREFRQRGLEGERLRHLIIDVLRREFGDRPLTFSLALHAADSSSGQSPADIDAMLPLADTAIANEVVVVPDSAEEVSANILEFIPALGQWQLG